MHVINARNVNAALPLGLAYLTEHGIREDSRNGPVLRAPVPVATVYERPCERVLFNRQRDANPFFHIVEAAWMLAGRDDLAQLTPYVKRMAEYSDDGGVTSPGAYGKRWRDWSHPVGGYEAYEWDDQLDWVVKRLKADPHDRRVVIQMWDPAFDIFNADNGGKDVPCNLTALPWVGGGKLHLTVFCRSNDVIWGAYGANAVQFSVLLEYLAGHIGLPVGTYTQVSNNFHAYEATMPGDPKEYFSDDVYELGMVQTCGMFDGVNSPGMPTLPEKYIQEDLKVFFEHGAVEAVTKARWPWIRRVLAPMALAHQAQRGRGAERFDTALEVVSQVQASDWRLAGKEWIQRRKNAYLKAADDGVPHV